MPRLLNLDFGDPPVILRVEGTVGGLGFDWVPHSHGARICPTSDEKQAENVRRAVGRVELIERDDMIRVRSAVNYFYTASRLLDSGLLPAEFLAEALLNFAKALESLFGGSIDEIRAGLRDLGYTEEDIEWRFTPVMVLRSKLDVAHAKFARFAPDELPVIHDFVDSCQGNLQLLLQRIVERAESGTLKLRPYAPAPASEVAPIVRKLIDNRAKWASANPEQTERKSVTLTKPLT